MSVVLRHQISGATDAPTVVLGPSLGTTRDVWQPQIAALSTRWRIVAFDLPGHGGSPDPDRPISIEDLAGGVIALLDRLRVQTFGYCGLSLGGAIGQVLGARYAERIPALVLCCTSARFGEAADSWRLRAAQVRAEGTAWLAGPSQGRWFAPGFVDRAPATARRLLAMIPATRAEGYAACCDALAGFDGRPLLDAITAPTLVIAGADDPATPPDMAEELAAGIKHASLAVLPDAAHLANVEQPGAVTGLIGAHLEQHLR